MATQFNEVRLNDGLDASLTPRWLMVPLSGFKQVNLSSAHGLTVVSAAPATATVKTLSSGLFQINGVTAGTALIEARNSAGTVVAKLEVEVLAKKTIPTAFHFVKDSAGHKTRRDPKSADAWMSVMNSIYLAQANIEFSKLKAGPVVIPKNLGQVVGTQRAAVGAAQKWDTTTEWNDVIAKGDPAARFNVFFVWEYEESQKPYTDVADAATEVGGKNCLFEDKAGKEIGETLAHEVGHALNLNDTYIAADKRLLMYGYTDSRGRKLRKADVTTARASV